MNWFRLYSEARTDAKLRSLTDAQFRVWFNLLCYASDQEEQGVITEQDRELLALEVSGCDEELLESTLSRLSRLKIVTVTSEEISFVNWAKRQKPAFPSESPTATAERKRRQREKERQSRQNEIETTPEQRNGADLSRPVTSSHEYGHECHARAQRAEQSRAEETRQEQSRAEQTREVVTVRDTEPLPACLPSVASDGSALPPLDAYAARLPELARGLLAPVELDDLRSSHPPSDAHCFTDAEIAKGLLIALKKPPNQRTNLKGLLYAKILPEVRNGREPPALPKPKPKAPTEDKQQQAANADFYAHGAAAYKAKGASFELPELPP